MATHPSPHSGLFDGSTHHFLVRVYYEDTDLSGVVYHANYLRWFERARSDMIRLLGIDQRAAADAGVGFFTVADLAIRYLSPAKLDDNIEIVSRLVELKASYVRLQQQALRDGQLLAEASLRVAFITPDGRARRQPDDWRSAFKTVLAAKDAA